MAPDAAAAGALQRFRDRLRPSHDSIERTLDLMSGTVDVAAYDRFLERSYGFITPCERALDTGTAPNALALPRRMKASVLERNLIARGHEPRRVAICSEVPVRGTWPADLGYLYVLEGSTLGSQMLLRHLAPRLGLDEQDTLFLRGYGVATGPMWKAFLQVLTAHLSASERAWQAIADSAESTFRALERWHREGAVVRSGEPAQRISGS